MSKQPSLPTFDKNKAVVIMPASRAKQSFVPTPGKVVCIQPFVADGAVTKKLTKPGKKTG